MARRPYLAIEPHVVDGTDGTVMINVTLKNIGQGPASNIAFRIIATNADLQNPVIVFDHTLANELYAGAFAVWEGGDVGLQVPRGAAAHNVVIATRYTDAITGNTFVGRLEVKWDGVVSGKPSMRFRHVTAKQR